MTPDQAIQALDMIGGGDPESAHANADEVLLALAPPEVRAAYERVADRCSWWAFA